MHLEINASLPQSMFGHRRYIPSEAKGRGHKAKSFPQDQGQSLRGVTEKNLP